MEYVNCDYATNIGHYKWQDTNEYLKSPEKQQVWPDHSCRVRGKKALSGRSYSPTCSLSSTCLNCSHTSVGANQHELQKSSTTKQNQRTKWLNVTLFLIYYFTGAWTDAFVCQTTNKALKFRLCFVSPDSPPAVQVLWNIETPPWRCTPDWGDKTLLSPSLSDAAKQ